MDVGGQHRHLVAREDPPLYDRLHRLAIEGRMIFFAGLPGTGKSLLIHQLAHLAHAGGREVHLLQWDVVRPLFEAEEAGRRYPTLRGVTHSVIRKAVGVWARGALIAWAERCPAPQHLLIGETPLVGHRLIELARQGDDAAEPLLGSATCQFVIPVPSREVRRHLEGERTRRIRQPKHRREREDAPPEVLQNLWEQLLDAARALGLEAGPEQDLPRPYDPSLYERVYRVVLTHRHVHTLAVETILPSAAFSVYEFAIPTRELVPAPPEANRAIGEVERQYPHLERLQDEVARWYLV